MAIINERIKGMRLSRNLSLLEVAEYLGVKEATAQRYESGAIKNIKHETIVALSRLFNCSPTYLMGWEDKPNDIFYLLGNHLDSLSDDEESFLFTLFSKTPNERKKHIEYLSKICSLSGNTKSLIEYLVNSSGRESARVDALIGGILEVLNDKNG